MKKRGMRIKMSKRAQSGIIINNPNGHIDIVKNFFGWEINPIVINAEVIEPQTFSKSLTARLSLNEIAREVKLRDLEHNSKITRLKGLRDKDFARLAKYQKAYEYLKQERQL